MKYAFPFGVIAVMGLIIGQFIGIGPVGPAQFSSSKPRAAALDLAEPGDDGGLEEEKAFVEEPEHGRDEVDETVALIDGVEVRGMVVTENDCVYAEFGFSNPGRSAAELSVNYVALRTPGDSGFSRVGPRPQVESRGKIEVCLQPKETARKRIMVKKTRAEAVEADSGDERIADVWTLQVGKDRSANVEAHAARAPVSRAGKVRMERGSVVLHVTSMN